MAKKVIVENLGQKREVEIHGKNLDSRTGTKIIGGGGNPDKGVEILDRNKKSDA